MVDMLKIEFSWGTLTAGDLVDYVPYPLTEKDFKDITGKDFKTFKK